MTEAEPEVGWAVYDGRDRHIGTVDAVFADYLLIRTGGLLPVDLYVPVTAISPADVEAAVRVAAIDVKAAYRSWHRPLKQAPHD